MTGDCHAPFCGSTGVRFPRATRPCPCGSCFDCIRQGTAYVLQRSFMSLVDGTVE